MILLYWSVRVRGEGKRREKRDERSEVGRGEDKGKEWEKKEGEGKGRERGGEGEGKEGEEGRRDGRGGGRGRRGEEREGSGRRGSKLNDLMVPKTTCSGSFFLMNLSTVSESVWLFGFGRWGSHPGPLPLSSHAERADGPGCPPNHTTTLPDNN